MDVGADTPLFDEIGLRVVDLIAEKSGSVVTLDGVRPLTQANSADRKRAYCLVDVRMGDGSPSTFFVKLGFPISERNLAIQQFLSDNRIPAFDAPRFWGHLDLGSRNRMAWMGIWDFIPKEPKPTAKMWKSAEAKIVEASAALAALTAKVSPEVAIAPAPRYFKDPPRTFDALAEILGFDPKYSELLADLKHAASRHLPAALARLKALPATLAHNDYRRANMHIRPDGSLVLYDWDGASLAPCGATLRTFVRLSDPAQADIAALFSRTVQAGDLDCGPGDILFSMRAMAVLHAINFASKPFGATQSGLAIMEWGLKHLHYLRA